MVITVISQKGGVAKTTTVATLARVWAAYKPLVIDTDPRNDIAKFKLKGVKALACLPIAVDETLAANPRRLVLIDCPPDVRTCVQAIRAADLVIIPSSPEPLDMWATHGLLNSFDAGTFGPDVKVRLLFTRYRSLWRSVTEQAKADYGERVLKTRISRANAVVDASEQRLTVMDTAPDSPVGRQYKRLGSEILTYE